MKLIVDFERRFLSLLSYQFREFSCFLGLDILNNKIAKKSQTSKGSPPFFPLLSFLT